MQEEGRGVVDSRLTLCNVQEEGRGLRRCDEAFTALELTLKMSLNTVTGRASTELHHSATEN